MAASTARRIRRRELKVFPFGPSTPRHATVFFLDPRVLKALGEFANLTVQVWTEEEWGKLADWERPDHELVRALPGIGFVEFKWVDALEARGIREEGEGYVRELFG